MNYISINPSVNRTEVNDLYKGEYYDWLCDIINLKPNTYDILIYELYSINFEWVIELDSNRAEDGLILRGEFYSIDNFEAMQNKPCSVLEALIGLAIKMDYILSDDDRGDRTRIWFWEMIDNLGLNRFEDSYFQDPFGKDLGRLNDIRSICSRWMERKFEYSGYGSPFPLNNPHDDQRNLHMIGQLNEYILEQHMFEDELL